MKIIFILILIFLIVYIVLFKFNAHSYNANKNILMEKPNHIEITLGESFTEFIKRYPSVKTSGQNFKEYGWMKWHKFYWSLNNPGQVSLKINNQKTIIQKVSYLSLTEDSDDVKSGVHDLHLQTSITSDTWLEDDEARLKFHNILTHLLANGWSYYLNLSDPHITSKESIRYKLNEEAFHYMDPHYLPTLTEWKILKKDSPNFWTLHYNSKIFMEIDLDTRQHKTDVHKTAYLVNIKIHNATEEAKRYFASDTSLPISRKNWHKHWVSR